MYVPREGDAVDTLTHYGQDDVFYTASLKTLLFLTRNTYKPKIK